MPTETPSARGTLQIQMFGGFCVKIGDTVVSDTSPRAQLVWKLFKYLLINRGKLVTADSLIELLWPDEDCYNPGKALQNLVYRLRNILPGEVDGRKTNYITFSHGSYGWNPAEQVEVDSGRFDLIYNKIAGGNLSPEEKREQYKTAIDIFKGDFLVESSYEEWVLPLAYHYRRLYSQCVYGLLEIYEAEKNDDAVIKLCEKAIAIDQFEETYHCKLISALVRQGKTSQAISHYEHITGLLQKELGVSPSPELAALGEEIFKDQSDIEYDLNTLFKQLSEPMVVTTGAFFCELETFKQIFRLERRATTRTGQATFLALLTITGNDYKTLETESLFQAMAVLKRVCVNSLRTSDVVAQLNKSQVILMFPALTLENGELVLERIINRFVREFRSAEIRVLPKIKAIN